MELPREVSESQIVVVSMDDLLIQIMDRLPLRALAQFKLVSKHWNSLVSDLLAFRLKPAGLILQSSFSFSRLGVSAPYAPLVVMFDKSSTSYKCQWLTSNHDLTGIWRLNITALTSCNGLLLCGSNDKEFIHYRYPRLHYYVCNPTTGKCFTLPKRDRCERLGGICLAFDPTKSPHYSVVCLVLVNFRSRFFEIEVFSSETGCWKKTGYLPFTEFADFSHGVYWNGSVHWICSSEMSIYFNPDDPQAPPNVMPTPPLQKNSSL